MRSKSIYKTRLELEDETIDDKVLAKLQKRFRTRKVEEGWMMIWQTLFLNKKPSLLILLSRLYITKGNAIDLGSFGIISMVYYINDPETFFTRKQLFKFKVTQAVF